MHCYLYNNQNNEKISTLIFIYIVKPILSGHFWNKEKVALKTGSIHMKFSMTR